MSKQTTNEKIALFVKMVRAETKLNGIKTILRNKRHIKCYAGKKTECLVNGYFCDDEMVLKCAVGQPINAWFPILVHEYAHFTQWKDQCDIWQNYGKYCQKYEEWFNGYKEFEQDEVNEIVRAVREVERDCEERVIKLIKYHNLPINPHKYAKNANAYVAFYNVVAKHRTWYNIGKEPYNVRKVLNVMPTYMFDDFDDLPKDVIPTIEKYCL